MEFGVWGLRFGGWGLGSRVWGLRFGVWGVGEGTGREPVKCPTAAYQCVGAKKIQQVPEPAVERIWHK